VRTRLYALLAVAALWGGAIAWRLWDLQVKHHDEYHDRASRQQQRVVELDPPRGAILDARGRELAVSVEVESAFAVPREIESPKAAAAALAGALHLDRARLERQLDADREFVWVARKLDPPQVEAVRALRLRGVHFLPESKRYYPLRELGAQVLGYVGTDDRGLGGLEAAFQAEIGGEPGKRTVLRDARRGTVLDPDLSFYDAVPGKNLHLTLDAALQYVLERELKAAVEERRAKSGSAVMLDPRDGAVLAMASYPTFDPNRFRDFDAESWRNRPIQDAYEPGSTFKMITAAAALEANVIDPEDVIDCEMGGITLAGVRISDHKPFGLLTLREVIAKSSNVGAIKTGLRAGEKRLYQSIRDFGFGDLTGVDLPGESAGIVRPVERWAPLQKAYVSFGQGLSVTALQLAAAFGAVANGGELLRPHVVAAIGDGAERRELHSHAEVVRRVASPQTLRSLERMLEAVVTEGTAKAAAVSGYAVAGKTGTAQKVIDGAYSPDRFVASFVGFAPAREPRIAGIVVLDEPRGAYHGGDVAAPVFGAFAREALLYLGVPPEREPLESWPREVAPPEVAPEPVAPEVAGVVLAANEGLPPAGPVVPDLHGFTARQALRSTARLGLRPVLEGQGFVEKQDPPAGAPLPPAGERIALWLGTGSR
jgi:cell division protein FtsI (penicillin-binding protein 3)